MKKINLKKLAIIIILFILIGLGLTHPKIKEVNSYFLPVFNEYETQSR